MPHYSLEFTRTTFLPEEAYKKPITSRFNTMRLLIDSLYAESLEEAIELGRVTVECSLTDKWSQSVVKPPVLVRAELLKDDRS